MFLRMMILFFLFLTLSHASWKPFTPLTLGFTPGDNLRFQAISDKSNTWFIVGIDSNRTFFIKSNGLGGSWTNPITLVLPNSCSYRGYRCQNLVSNPQDLEVVSYTSGQMSFLVRHYGKEVDTTLPPSTTTTTTTTSSTTQTTTTPYTSTTTTTTTSDTSTQTTTTTSTTSSTSYTTITKTTTTDTSTYVPVPVYKPVPTPTKFVPTGETPPIYTIPPNSPVNLAKRSTTDTDTFQETGNSCECLFLLNTYDDGNTFSMTNLGDSHNKGYNIKPLLRSGPGFYFSLIGLPQAPNIAKFYYDSSTVDPFPIPIILTDGATAVYDIAADKSGNFLFASTDSLSRSINWIYLDSNLNAINRGGIIIEGTNSAWLSVKSFDDTWLLCYLYITPTGDENTLACHSDDIGISNDFQRRNELGKTDFGMRQSALQSRYLSLSTNFNSNYNYQYSAYFASMITTNFKLLTTVLTSGTTIENHNLDLISRSAAPSIISGTVDKNYLNEVSGNLAVISDTNTTFLTAHFAYDSFSVPTIFYSWLTDDCATGNSGCQFGCGNGFNPFQTYNCTCPTNYQLQADRKTCLDMTNPCLRLPCYHICNVIGINTTECLCFSGYEYVPKVNPSISDQAYNLSKDSCAFVNNSVWALQAPTQTGPIMQNPSGLLVGDHVLYTFGKSKQTNNFNFFVPTLNKWAALQTPNIPNPRGNPTMVMADTYLLLIGGDDLSSLEIWAFDTLLFQWNAKIVNSPYGTLSNSACVAITTNSTNVYIYGGTHADGTISSDLYVYSVQTNKLKLISNLSKKRGLNWPPPMTNAIMFPKENATFGLFGGKTVGNRTITSYWQYKADMEKWSEIALSDPYQITTSGTDFLSTYAIVEGREQLVLVYPYKSGEEWSIVRLNEERKIPRWEYLSMGDVDMSVTPVQIFGRNLPGQIYPQIMLLAYDPFVQGLRVYGLSVGNLPLIDRCALRLHSCQHVCSNGSYTLTSYSCSCYSGFDLDGEICSLVTVVTDPLAFTLGLSIGIPVGVILLVALLITIVCLKRKTQLDLSALPSEIRWQYEQYFKSPSSWKAAGNPVYYTKTLTEGSQEYKKIIKIFTDKLCGEDLEIKSISAVFNPTLTSNFINTKKVLQSRFESSATIFKNESWRKLNEEPETKELREWVYDDLNNSTSQYSWNNDANPVKIIPTIHGTDLSVAQKICEAGFASLSSLDSGYYGRGIYFTTNALYSVPYFATKRNPAIIISYVMPGNVFPVVEHHKGENSLMGQALTSSYTSHYVITNIDGTPCQNKTTPQYFNELVIAQEGLVVPAYVIEVSTQGLPKLLNKFQRDLPNEERRKKKERKEKIVINEQEMQNMKVSSDDESPSGKEGEP